MKKYLLLGCALFTMAQGANAQDQERVVVGEHEPRFGIEGGINLNNMLDHYQGETVSNQLKVGFHAGVIADIMVMDHLSFQPGLRYIMKGGQQERNSTQMVGVTQYKVEAKDKLTLSYAELPLNLVFKFGGQDSKFFIGVGGYVAALLDAKTKYKYTADFTGTDGKAKQEQTDDIRDLRIGNNAGDEITRMDYGVNGLLGFEMNERFFVKGTVEAGLRDIAGERNYGAMSSILPNATDITSKNISYLLSIGYFFER